MTLYGLKRGELDGTLLALLGAAVASIFGAEPSQQMEEDLDRLKQWMEAGEIATTLGQPGGLR